jgi:hypothetical protein
LISNRGLGAWLPSYVREIWQRRRLRRWRAGNLTHLIFLVCDHFEPRHGVTQPGQSAARMQRWASGYRQMQDNIHAAYGKRPLHTWFYPPHHGLEHLAALSSMVFDGLGEVELHYHHHGDTEESLRRDLLRTFADYRRMGLLLSAGNPPVESFGFIHGDWALDNSHPQGDFCGVDSELSLLQELGCWGDLTMPSTDGCQTRKINSIYYAKDDPTRPKSHDWGEDARVGRSAQSGLLMMQGPLAVNWRSPGYPRIENASLTSENWGRPDRIRSWIDCHVHVRDRPEWLFIKLHTHGAVERDMPALFGEQALSMHRVLNEQFDDGRRFRLHYVTARQAYNLVRAAEQGHGGDPAQYLDFELGKQACAHYCVDVPHMLRVCTDERVDVQDIECANEALLRLARTGVQCRGRMRSAVVDNQSGSVRIELATDDESLSIRARDGAQLFDGAGRLIETLQGAQERQVHCGNKVELRIR